MISFCTGCRYGLHHLLPQTAKKYNIHIMFSGVNHFEASLYKRNIVCLDPNHPTFAGFFLGYGREILKNLHYCKHPAGLLFQAKEFFSSRSMDKYMQKNGIVSINPFATYFEWKQEDVKKVLEKLGWKKSISASQEWRSDCYLNFIRQFFYKQMLGYNDVDYKNAALLRSGKPVVEQKINEEEQRKVMRMLMKDYFNLDFDAVETKIKKFPVED